MFPNFILQLIILFLPTQLGWHFWPDFSRVAGIKIDYLSPTFYFTDFLLLLYIASNFSQVLSWFKKNLNPSLILLSFSFLNTFLSVSPINTSFWWLRLFLYLLFFLCLRLQKVSWLQIKASLIFSTALVIVIQVLQTLHQGSLNGPLYWLGERSFTFSTPGLAKISLLGQEILRSPSLFSHPNSLAGYLLVVCYLLFVFKSTLWPKIAFILSLLLTFSKGSLLAFLLVIILRISPTVLISSFLFFSLLQPFFPSLPDSLTFISDRLFFMDSFKRFFTSHPLFGLGLGGYIPALGQSLSGAFLTPAKLQPIHNLFLLALSEVGLFGFSLFGLLLTQKAPFFKKPRLLGLIALVCITGAFDHYWWTLPQDRLILFLALSVLL